MAKNINVGDTVYLLDDGGCTEHAVEEREILPGMRAGH